MQYLTTRQAAAILNVSPRQVLYFCNLPENPLPHRHPTTRIYRFVEHEIVEWFDKYRVGDREEEFSQEAWDLSIEDAQRMRELESKRERIHG